MSARRVDSEEVCVAGGGGESMPTVQLGWTGFFPALMGETGLCVVGVWWCCVGWVVEPAAFCGQGRT